MDATYEIWTDKYNAKKLNEIVGQDRNIKMLEIYTKYNFCDIPHLIVSGVSGIGKSLAIRNFLDELGIENENVLDVNITEDIRKITIIENKIYNFIERKLDKKVIIIDDCDVLNIQTQFLIKSIMDKSRRNLLIITICNRLENLTETLQTRVKILKFTKIKDESIYNYLKMICDKEDIKLTKEVLNTIVMCSLGDLRKAINCLQTICVVYNKYKKITMENVFEVLDIPQPNLIEDIILDDSYKSRINKMDKIFKMGYSSTDIIGSFFNVVKDMKIDMNDKIRYIDKITFVQIKINDGLDSKLQIYNLLSVFNR